jgi:CheY-like chemotaxis protein
MTSVVSSVMEDTGTHPVLVVDDQKVAREEMVRLLARDNWKTRTLASGQEATNFASEHGVSVVLMDIQMGGDIDGIDAACAIQQSHPAASVIFVTAHAQDRDYLQRVEDSDLSVAAWLDKPVHPEEVLKLVGKESQKVRIRNAMAKALDAGVAPLDFLRSIGVWDSGFSSSAIHEIRDEIPRRIDKRDIRIEQLYSELRALSHIGPVSLEASAQVATKLAELHALQHAEAAEFERRFIGRLALQPGSGRQALEEARRLLDL